MVKYGVRCSALEFYEAVNLSFHAAEAPVYDQIHRSMWETLPQQFELLTEDFNSDLLKGPLRLLDIGCGTGLSTTLFRKTRMGRRVQDITLVDTSREMLELAKHQARSWPAKCRAFCGKVEELPLDQFDVIITCSVLHHIADLHSFLNEIAKRQKPGGIYLHLQDPNADFASDPEYLARCAQYKAVREPPRKSPLYRRLTLRRICKRILRELGAPRNYIEATNRSLLKAGVIRREMSETDIWLVTDIRISEHEHGISLKEMKSILEPRYQLVSSRSYDFFGTLRENLPLSMRVEEERLILDRQMNGANFGAVWKLTS